MVPMVVKIIYNILFSSESSKSTGKREGSRRPCILSAANRGTKMDSRACHRIFIGEAEAGTHRRTNSLRDKKVDQLAPCTPLSPAGNDH